MSGVKIAPAVLAAALAQLDFIAAVKAEAPPTAAAIASLTERLDVPVFGGLGGIGLLDELAAGAAGAMTGFSYPEALLACVHRFTEDGYAGAREAFLPYLPLVNFEQQAGIALGVRKESLRRRGLIAEAVRPTTRGRDARVPRSAAATAPRRAARAALHDLADGGGTLMDLGLTDRTAVVCASTGGLGAAVARALGREGAHVVVSGRAGERG